MGDRPGAARMFAPAIGVDEDVANANSTGCLAAHLLDTTGAQTVAIEVEQGDTLGRPASVLASARRGPAGITTRVGGLAVVRDGHRGGPGRRPTTRCCSVDTTAPSRSPRLPSQHGHGGREFRRARTFGRGESTGVERLECHRPRRGPAEILDAGDNLRNRSGVSDS